MNIESFVLTILREAAMDTLVRGPKLGQTHAIVRFLLASQKEAS
jgi:hypothetical protein